MSDATFATVSKAGYAILHRLMPSSTPPTYEGWIFLLYERMVDHRGRNPDNRVSLVDINPHDAARYLRGNGSGNPSLTELDNYAYSLGRPFTNTDPDAFLAAFAPRPRAR